MGWQTDLDALAAFRSRLDAPFRLPDIAAASPGEDVVGAAWRVVRDAAVGVPRPKIDAKTNGLVELAAMILGAVGGFGARALDEIALGPAHPAGDTALVPLLLTITGEDSDLFFRALRDAIAGDDDARAVRALQLVRAGYGGRFPFHVTREQAEALEAAVEGRKARGTRHEGLARALDTFIPPAAR